MRRSFAVVWAILLGVSYGVVVPTLLTLLQQSLDASRQIERYTAEIRRHAGGIERNTTQVAALKQTTAAAPRLLEVAESLDRHTASIQATLGGVGDGHLQAEEGKP